jgi:N-acyl amino acid synthase of PEP-CTERM/exosortase system
LGIIVNSTVAIESASLTPRFTFRRLETSAELEASYRLRYLVFCEEAGLIPREECPDGREVDEYDRDALHLGAFDLGAFSVDGTMIGSLRILRSATMDLPLFDHCDPGQIRFPPDCQGVAAAEISRLALSKTYRRRADDGLYGMGGVFDGGRQPQDTECPVVKLRKAEIVMGLYRLMYQESKRRGIEYWIAAMEPSLERLLERFGVGFEEAGPGFDYYGLVIPYFIRLRDLEVRVYHERPQMYIEFTQGLAPELRPALSV